MRTSMINMSQIADFHDTISKGFRSRVAAINEALEQRGDLSEREIAELRTQKNTYSDTFEPYLRINTFLMMVSCLEEWLFHTWKQHAPKTGLLEAKGSIGRFKPVLKQLGVDLSRSGPWMFLKGCQDIRSCLLHANGQISLNRNPERVRNFVASHSDKIRIESDRLVLDKKFLGSFRDAAEQLMESVGNIQL